MAGPGRTARVVFYAQAFSAQEVGERFTGPGGELIHAEIRIGDSVVMITQDAMDGPARSPDQLGGMVTCVMALYWQDVDAAWERAVAAGTRLSGSYGLSSEYADVAAVAAVLASEQGGPVDVAGHSIGATCVLGAAAGGAPFRRVVLYEPPGPQATQTNGRCIRHPDAELTARE